MSITGYPMEDVRGEVKRLLDEKPEMESPLENLTTIDKQSTSWTFEDIPLDSGEFGELVSRDIVEKTPDGDYRLANREGVIAALSEDSHEATSGETLSHIWWSRLQDAISLRPIDPLEVLILGVALTVLALFRLLPLPSVLRPDAVVLSSNDPYFYRHLVNGLVDLASGPFDFAILANLPRNVALGEPLMVTTLWWFSALAGGSENAVGLVLAFYPVLSAVIVGLLVYLLVMTLTDDVRVGLATVGLLAITPIHAVRTGLGFADHHAFDYLWLAFTALMLVKLLHGGRTDRRRWWPAAGLGIGIAGQALSWNAGSILLVPVGFVTVFVAMEDLRSDVNVVRARAPLLAGTALGAVIVYGVHRIAGWNDTVAATAPTLLFVGCLGVVLATETGRRLELHPRVLFGGLSLGGLGAAAILWATFPLFSTAVGQGVRFLLTTEGISETRSLFTATLGGLFAPVFQFGFGLFLALPFLGYATWDAYRDTVDGWVVPITYGWAFLLLSLVQVRFSGELALFVAIFGGFGFVRLAAWVDLADGPKLRPEESGHHRTADADVAPNRRQFLGLGALAVGVGGLGALLIPIEQRQVGVGGRRYEVAMTIARYVDEHGLSYPDSYVLSRWTWNRFYNYHANGATSGYGYARWMYDHFLSSTDIAEMFASTHQRIGFLVVDRSTGTTDYGQDSVYRQLTERFGELERFRAIYVDDESGLMAFAMVLGATVTGSATPDSTVTASTTVSIPHTSFEYSRTVTVESDGTFEVRVPYPGSYQIAGSPVEVSEDAVQAGRTVER